MYDLNPETDVGREGDLATSTGQDIEGGTVSVRETENSHSSEKNRVRVTKKVERSE